jgi:CRP-like cAMP-binding protein
LRCSPATPPTSAAARLQPGRSRRRSTADEKPGRSGRASVERDECHVADLGAGDFFGELALLRCGRRTASVVAATDMRVRVIRRGEFIDAMRRLPTLASSVQEAALAR